MQEAGIAQSLSVAQVALQALVPQANGKQEDEAGIPQVPAPSQVPPGVKVVPAAGQVAALAGGPQLVLFAGPRRWHLPSVPQLAGPLSTQLPAGSGPEATAVHCPIVPVMRTTGRHRRRRWRSRRPGRRTSTEFDVVRATGTDGLRPQEPAVQTFPDEHELLSLQLEKQRAAVADEGGAGEGVGDVAFPVGVAGRVAGCRCRRCSSRTRTRCRSAYLWQPPGAVAGAVGPAGRRPLLIDAHAGGRSPPAGLDARCRARSTARSSGRHRCRRGRSRRRRRRSWRRIRRAAEQVCPFDFGPQLPVARSCARSAFGVAAQWLVQAPPLH